MVFIAISFLLTSPIANMATILIHFQEKFALKLRLVKSKGGSTVRYAGTVRHFCNGMGMVRWYGTLQNLN